MLRSTSVLAVLALSGAMAMGADKIKSKDADFLKDAAIGAMSEVNMGALAQQQGSSDAIKDFGKRMATDHKAELADLKTLAQSKGVELPTEVDKSHKKMADKMAKLSGSDFDKAYAKDMLEDHEKDVKEFKKEADKASDPDVKAFAAKQVPTLEEHLSMAQKLPGNEKHNKEPNAAVSVRQGHQDRPHGTPEK